MAQKKSLRIVFLILILAVLTALVVFFAVRGTKKASAKNAGETSLKVIISVDVADGKSATAGQTLMGIRSIWYE